MRDAGLILGLSFCGLGLLFVCLSLPLILRRVSMNRLYGVRIAKAFESEANWYAINAYGGRVLAAAGAAIAAVGTLLAVFPPSSVVAISLASLAPLPILLLAVVPILRYAQRLQ